MTIPSLPSMPSAPRLTVVEDGGLGALLGGRGGASAARGSESSDSPSGDILAIVRDLLREKIPLELLDPVAPAEQRIPFVLGVLRQAIGEQIETGGPLRSVATDEATLRALYHDSLGWGPAQPYLDDKRVQEIKIVGTQILVQEDGADFVVVPEHFDDPKQVLDRARVLAAMMGVTLDAHHPQGTLPLAHGTRMHLTIPPCTPSGQALVCIRRGRSYAWTLEDILRRDGFSAAVRDLLVLFARARCSFLIAGETGSGKTALLESIINSWPGTPHVITIEDNALEINVRHAAWTRELVQTMAEPGAFGRAAREALRQTPTIVAPGETRAEEAGAILTIAVSGHAVITTLHAKSCQAAVQRFADCAAMPGAYTYAGRRDNALEDTCDNLEVVIHVEKLGGRRFISEIALLDGVEHASGGVPRPRLIPLVEMVVDDEGQLTWVPQVVADDTTLTWRDGADRTPAGLRQKLRLLRAESRVRAVPTSRAAVEEAISRAAQAVSSGQLDLALATLRRAWGERRDPRLIVAAAHALHTDPARMAETAAASERAAADVEALLACRAWGPARARLDQAEADLVCTAALTPAGRWAQLAASAATGLEIDREVRARTERARTALSQGSDPQEVIDLLGADRSDRASPATALVALHVRHDALTQLVARGNEGGAAALAATRAQIQALTQQEQGGSDA